MGSVQDIKKAFMELSVTEREQLLHELKNSMQQVKAEPSIYVPTEKQRELGITPEMVAKHPLLKFAGIWSEEEADRIEAAIKAADWIDEDDEGCFG